MHGAEEARLGLMALARSHALVTRHAFQFRRLPAATLVHFGAIFEIQIKNHEQVSRMRQVNKILEAIY